MSRSLRRDRRTQVTRDAPGAATTQERPGESPKATRSRQPRKTDRPRRPFYARLLGLRHIRPNAWQRALLGEGSLAIAVLLVLADLVSAWAMLALPIATALIVKAHDLLAGALARRGRTDVPDASQAAGRGVAGQ